MGVASGFIEKLTRNSSLFFLSKIFPIPSKTSSYYCSIFSKSDFALSSRTDLTLLLYLIRSSFASFKDPSGLISIIPSSVSAFLPSRGGEFIFPLTTTNVVSVPLV